MDFEAERMKEIPFSSIRQMFERVNALEAQGKPPVAFHIGRPDFDTPDHIKAAAKTALDRGVTAYTSNYGLPQLRRAIAEKLRADNGMNVDPDRQIIVTVGANEAILLAMMATLNPGDEILIPDPMWLHYFYCARLCGAQVVGVPLRKENGYQLDPDDIRSRITPSTRMLVLNSPHNPTGVVFTRDTIERAVAIVEQHDLLLMSDEIYEKMIYDSCEHISPGAMTRVAERTITINGFSKAYAMTGWRLGYVVASPSLTSIMIRVHQYTTVCATSFAQVGAVAALTGPQACVSDMVAEFDRRRLAIIAAFDEIGDGLLVRPGGAFYAFPDVSGLGLNSATIANSLLDEAGIAVVPGSAFGEMGEGHIRISYACSLADVQRGMEVFREYWHARIA